MSSYAAETTLRTLGVDVELFRFVETSSGSRGTTYEISDESPETIPAVPDPGGRSLSWGDFGAEVEADMVYLVDAAEPIEDGGGEGASVIRQDGTAYRVVERDASLAELSASGLAVLECDADRELELPGGNS